MREERRGEKRRGKEGGKMGNREGEEGRRELMQKQEGEKRKRGWEGGPGAEQWKQEKRG